MRRRGTVPRIQMNTATSVISFRKNHAQDGIQSSHENGAVQPPRNNVMPSQLTANKPRYSPRKNSANLKPEYSTKYPAMISDSASGRSKGERLDSASPAIKNRMKPAKPQGVNTNQCATVAVWSAWASTIFTSDNEPTTMITVIAESTSGTS